MAKCSTIDQQLSVLRSGDSRVLPELFQSYRPRLRDMVRIRIGAQLASRIDPSDVLQEAFIDAQRRVGEYMKHPEVSFFIWLRGMVWNRLRKLQRRHIGAQRRSVEREVNLPEDASVAVANSLTSPSEKMARSELRQVVETAIDELNESDREVILMRYFEGLSNSEVAAALSLTPAGATMRHGRALTRLKDVLQRRLRGQEDSR
jgi:RNA polymerase sigma-70 factor (ECF subfamily)